MNDELRWNNEQVIWDPINWLRNFFLKWPIDALLWDQSSKLSRHVSHFHFYPSTQKERNGYFLIELKKPKGKASTYQRVIRFRPWVMGGIYSNRDTLLFWLASRRSRTQWIAWYRHHHVTRIINLTLEALSSVQSCEERVGVDYIYISPRWLVCIDKKVGNKVRTSAYAKVKGRINKTFGRYDQLKKKNEFMKRLPRN